MATVFGGIPKRKQINKIKRGVSLIIATPGRLLDLNQMKILDLSAVQVLVLDEADRMMDMGFYERHDPHSTKASQDSSNALLVRRCLQISSSYRNICCTNRCGWK